jgi:hypothetical protein
MIRTDLPLFQSINRSVVRIIVGPIINTIAIDPLNEEIYRIVKSLSIGNDRVRNVVVALESDDVLIDKFKESPDKVGSPVRLTRCSGEKRELLGRRRCTRICRAR